MDHRGDEASLLADSVWDWDEVTDRGPEAFAREVGSLDKRGGRRAVPGGGNGGFRNGNGGGYGNGGGGGPRPPVAVGPGVPAGTPAAVASTAGPGTLPPIAPAEPISTYAEPPDLETVATGAGGPEPEEPALPDEARGVASAAAQAPSVPVEASATAILNVRFAREAGPDRVVAAMQAFKGVLRERPGGTRVVVHVPAPGGAALPMELKGGVAYDAELVAEVRRRIGEGVVDLHLV